MKVNTKMPLQAVMNHSKRLSSYDSKPEKTLVDAAIYDSREEFAVLALTGPIGNESDSFAHLVSQPFDSWKGQVRELQSFANVAYGDTLIGAKPHKQIKELVFKRKYTICYNFVDAFYKPYTTIKYNKVVVLYALKLILEAERYILPLDLIHVFCEEIKVLLSKNSDWIEYSNKQKEGYLDSCIQHIEDALGKIADDIHKIIAYLPAAILNPFDDWSKENHEEIVNVFEQPEIQKYVNIYLNKHLWSDAVLKDNSIYAINRIILQEDYFLYSLLMNLMATNIRFYGHPFVEEARYAKRTSTLFNLVELINIAIKYSQDKKNRRFCIDSIRNSLEARYLKERYNAFYYIALHHVNPDEVIERAIAGSSHAANLEAMTNAVKKLAKSEVKSKEHTSGNFSKPNVEQCVAEAEIHILNNSKESNEDNSPIFYSTAEQWMKYAALILHPGLITPSSEERCMEVAYTAKFNSGCVSRQVGAVITNKDHAIRSIGWNDVPYGQIPCALRQIPDIVNVASWAEDDERKWMYSEFESGVSNKTNIYKDGDTFAQKVIKDYGVNTQNGQISSKLKCFPHVFCFRGLHNKYLGDNNQVFGRSLHAEENAMMQITRNGGEGLESGIIYVTASPCELCSRKLYQIGVRKIVYIDPYPGIAREQTIASGFNKPELKVYQGAFGATYYKLFTPLMAPKDEVALRCKQTKGDLLTKEDVIRRLEAVLNKYNIKINLTSPTFTQEEVSEATREIEKIIENSKGDRAIIVKNIVHVLHVIHIEIQ